MILLFVYLGGIGGRHDFGSDTGYGILDESIIRPACRDCLSTASLKNFPAVFLSEAENAYTLAIGLNLILPTGEHMVDHILRIWANCCGFSIVPL